MDVLEKLTVLTDAAKYDAACTSSGGTRSAKKGYIGNTSTALAGCCHTFSADGRCVTLLKVLLTNRCVYDCKYCVNRRSNDTKRAAFTPEELADLTIQFYRRNYIEGLFLSSGVFRSPDYTTELMIRVLSLLREQYRFNGYIHAKAIPGAAPELVERLRQSVNPELLELPLEWMKARGGLGVPTIKPWGMETVLEKVEKARAANPPAIAMDVDSAGLPFLAAQGGDAGPKGVKALRQVAQAAGLPFIVKGVMTVEGAKKALEAGAWGIVVSNHGGRVLDHTPATCEVLPEIAGKIAEPLAQIDKITIIGGDGSGVGSVADNVPTVMARLIESMKDTTGIDLTEVIKADTYDAKVNRNLNITGLGEGVPAPEVKVDLGAGDAAIE